MFNFVIIFLQIYVSHQNYLLLDHYYFFNAIFFFFLFYMINHFMTILISKINFLNSRLQPKEFLNVN